MQQLNGGRLEIPFGRKILPWSKMTNYSDWFESKRAKIFLSLGTCACACMGACMHVHVRVGVGASGCGCMWVCVRVKTIMICFLFKSLFSQNKGCCETFSWLIKLLNVSAILRNLIFWCCVNSLFINIFWTKPGDVGTWLITELGLMKACCNLLYFNANLESLDWAN